MSEITIPHVQPPFPFEAYTHMIEPLSDEDGGDYLITFPDLPGCMADGETIETSVKKKCPNSAATLIYPRFDSTRMCQHFRCP